MFTVLLALAFNATLMAWNGYVYLSTNNRHYAVFCAFNSVACILLVFAWAVSR